MSLFLSMLPFYLFGNIHCIGMCGPLVMMIGKHRYRVFYFFGRILSFSLAGLLAGGIGSVFGVLMQELHISGATGIFFGTLIFCLGISYLTGKKLPFEGKIAKQLAPFHRKISVLIMKDTPGATFLFGFFTIFLPCGQTVIVFSACALYGYAVAGFFNGMAFALLTTPALLLSMEATRLLYRFKQHYDTLIGIFACLIGVLTICRGCADLGVIPHLILNPESSPAYHIVIY